MIPAQQQLLSPWRMVICVCLLTPAALADGPGSTKGQPAASKSSATDATAASNVNGKTDGKVVKSGAEWRKLLTKEQFRVTRLKGTETAYTGAYWQTKKDGLYRCVCCGQTLFDSRTKFDSGTGWPSFWEPVEKNAVHYHVDNSAAEARLEVVCSRCDAHLGHVFSDGPLPTGQRYCMNSAALKHVHRNGAAEHDAKTEKSSTARKKR